MLFLNKLHLHVSDTFDHHQGACCAEYSDLTLRAFVQDTITNMSSRFKP